MPGGTRHSSKPKGYLAILDAAKLLRQPLTSEAAASKILKVICDDLPNSPPSTPRARQRLTGKQAAQLSSCGTAVLQCAGWLVAARGVNASVADAYTHATGMCVMFAVRALLQAPVQPELLKPLLHSSAGGHVPGRHLRPLAVGGMLASLHCT
jgi:hypothetical protein